MKGGNEMKIDLTAFAEWYLKQKEREEEIHNGRDVKSKDFKSSPGNSDTGEYGQHRQLVSTTADSE
jgi:hypothetical protein